MLHLLAFFIILNPEYGSHKQTTIFGSKVMLKPQPNKLIKTKISEA